MEDIEEETRSLAAEMGGVTILRKGRVDVISNGVKGKNNTMKPVLWDPRSWLA